MAQIPVSLLKAQVSVADGTAGAPSVSFSNDTNTGIYRAGTDALGVVTAGVERIRVGSNGNVGIGVTNPQNKLEVNGNMRVLGKALFSTVVLPVWTNESRPLMPDIGTVGFNTNSRITELWDGSTWTFIGSNFLLGSSVNNPANSAKEIKLVNPNAQSGIYYIKWDGTNVYPIYCEMSLEGGGWMMILNYNRGTTGNPELLVRSNSFPRMGNEYTYADESGSTSTETGTWGHISNALANSNPWTEYMFYGKKASHTRVIHFRGNNTNIVNYIKTGSGSMTPHYAEPSTNFNGSLRVNATIPLSMSTNEGFTNQGNLAMTAFPIYGNSSIGENPRAHWGIKGSGNRWEADDSESSAHATIHRIWVR